MLNPPLINPSPPKNSQNSHSQTSTFRLTRPANGIPIRENPRHPRHLRADPALGVRATSRIQSQSSLSAPLIQDPTNSPRVAPDAGRQTPATRWQRWAQRWEYGILTLILLV